MISNTSPLINLGKVDALDLIPALFSHDNYDVIVPTEVIEEINPPLNDQIRAMEKKGKIIISPPFISSIMNNVIPIAEEIAINAQIWNPSQHYTEACVIVKGNMAKIALGSAFVLIDEKVAKTIAKKKGLRAMTHVNIIEECARKEIITQSEALNLLEKLVSKGVKYRTGMLEHYRTVWV